MRATSRWIASAFVGGLGLVCLSAGASAQVGSAVPQAVTRMASLTPGAIEGVVRDEKGLPIAGAMVSALGATSAFTVTDRSGRFEMRTLSPGPYLVRAHLSGYVASHGQIVDVRPSARASSAIALRHASSASTESAGLPVLAAGFGGAADPAAAPPAESGATGTAGNLPPDDDHGETAWRLRHARRGILKDTTAIDSILAEADAPQNAFAPAGIFGRTVESPARLAANFFSGAPLSGQFNLLTTSSFDSPQQLFSGDSFARGVAYLSVGAPVGQHADWTVRGAMTQGDVASWIVAGEYVTRAPARHQYDLGLSYATERYEAGNFATLYNVTDGSRNAGTVYGYDAFTVTPTITVSYGARYGRYDYLANSSLWSPRVALTFTPAEHVRINTFVSSRAVAPGAEEFLPPADSAIVLPPQRTFSALNPGTPLVAERTTHAEVHLERDVAGSTISVRTFRQHVADQLVTVFGVDVPGQPATEIGHYFLANTGNVDATGWAAGFRTALVGRVHGSIEYSQTFAHWQPSDLGFVLLLAPAAAQLESQQIHDVTTALETEVPETATKVMVLYRISNGFARPFSGGTQADSRPSIDSRFDVQIRQALPFMDFSTARWEMLVAVRNFFRDPATDQSVYDELLVVRPPKRIIGGLTLHF
jgi:Carboxypeptidase regulatory-like domain/TonB dependent receptor